MINVDHGLEDAEAKNDSIVEGQQQLSRATDHPSKGEK
jgi:hypothetical protein